uniref:P3a protein n=1 Tax=Pea enation mosaic virus-1 TaxID=193121 RepID=A0A6M8P7Y2_PEMV1|nr:P3a protein [Pea enation mosaic virus 1]QKG33094.1 P3a protein [Pea enation mosaic virus 1]QKG33101.1 P3a protein [Pea enation mosaic virus 1]QKG33108.1 P3a protein [Pea enation mosaic virus 1]QKG33115.1 P3a protein [Pea enation mosaic virus 1]
MVPVRKDFKLFYRWQAVLQICGLSTWDPPYPSEN